MARSIKKGPYIGESLLKKIEELTLYVIQQNKQIELLKQENQKLLSIQSQLDELKNEIRRTAEQTR